MRKLDLRIAAGAFIALLLAVLCLSVTDEALSPTGSFAYGCDDFAYQRQAELIRSRGLPRGLDARIGGPDAEALILLAKGSGLPEAEWQKVLGPHCHHVDAHSGHLIAQYPPGTPLVLSLFPRGTAGYGAYLVFVVTSILAGLLILTLGTPTAGQVGIATLFAMEVCRYFFIPSSWASYSVGISAGFAMLVPSLLLVAPRNRWVSMAHFALIGLLAGLFAAVRLPNAFVIAGLAILLVGRLDVDRLHLLRVRWIELAIGAAAFLVSGPGLVAAGNRINTGSPFHTTYGSGDAAGGVWSFALLAHHARFYLLESDAATIVDMSLAVVALSAVIAASRYASGAFRWAALSAIATTSVSLVFFFTHEITAPYYLVPSAIFSVAAPTMTAISSESIFRLPPMRFGAIAGAILVLGVALYRAPSSSKAPPFTFAIPSEVIAPGTVVWDDLASGTLLYYNDKLATKIAFASPCDRRKLIAAAQHAGRPQYIIDDSPIMHDEIEALSKSAILTRVGDYEVFQPLPIYRIDGISPNMGDCSQDG